LFIERVYLITVPVSFVVDRGEAATVATLFNLAAVAPTTPKIRLRSLAP
jgi:hypothetical protein